MSFYLFNYSNEYLRIFEWYQKIKALAHGIDVRSASIERV